MHTVYTYCTTVLALMAGRMKLESNAIYACIANLAVCAMYVCARIKILALHGMTKDAWKRFSDDGYRHYQVVEKIKRDAPKKTKKYQKISKL